jgi:hypothetical protein
LVFRGGHPIGLDQNTCVNYFFEDYPTPTCQNRLKTNKKRHESTDEPTTKPAVEPACTLILLAGAPPSASTLVVL